MSCSKLCSSRYSSHISNIFDFTYDHHLSNVKIVKATMSVPFYFKCEKFELRNNS